MQRGLRDLTTNRGGSSSRNTAGMHGLTLKVAGGAVEKVLFSCPTGRVLCFCVRAKGAQNRGYPRDRGFFNSPWANIEYDER